MTTPVFALESLFSTFDETNALWRAHWGETEAAYRKAPLDPDVDQFRRLEELGWSKYFTARIDGKLVGHLYFIVHTNRHTRSKNAVEDFYFFLPEHRKGMDAIKLLRYAVAELREQGCEQIGMSSKLTGTKDIDPLLRRVGFRHVANFYVI
jgi:L-amino acid N-acyltransferase YncA